MSNNRSITTDLYFVTRYTLLLYIDDQIIIDMAAHLILYKWLKSKDVIILKNKIAQTYLGVIIVCTLNDLTFTSL